MMSTVLGYAITGQSLEPLEIHAQGFSDEELLDPATALYAQLYLRTSKNAGNDYFYQILTDLRLRREEHIESMVVNAKCNTCKEPTKYVAGFFDGPRGRHGCLFDCKNEQCEVYQVKRFTESEAVKERIKIQNLNSQKGMYAGYIAALRKDAKITMMKMSQIAGCSPAEYSSYEHERKEFDPEIYRKCEKYLKEKEGGGRC